MSIRTGRATPNIPKEREKCRKEGGFCNERDAYGLCLKPDACDWKDPYYTILRVKRRPSG